MGLTEIVAEVCSSRGRVRWMAEGEDADAAGRWVWPLPAGGAVTPESLGANEGLEAMQRKYTDS